MSKLDRCANEAGIIKAYDYQQNLAPIEQRREEAQEAVELRREELRTARDTFTRVGAACNLRAAARKLVSLMEAEA